MTDNDDVGHLPIQANLYWKKNIIMLKYINQKERGK